MGKKILMTLLLSAGTILVSNVVMAEGQLTASEKNLLELEGEYSSDVAYFFCK